MNLTHPLRGSCQGGVLASAKTPENFETVMDGGPHAAACRLSHGTRGPFPTPTLWLQILGGKVSPWKNLFCVFLIVMTHGPYHSTRNVPEMTELSYLCHEHVD